MAGRPTYVNSPSHATARDLARREWQSTGKIAIDIDLGPLANALAMLPREMWQSKGSMILARGFKRAIDKFNSAAHRELKADTKIRKPTRLKKGVRTWVSGSGSAGVAGWYRIRDRNIRITKPYFGAHYRPYGKPGARARWGKSFSPAGATWTSWDGTRTGKRTFMIPGRAPVFIRLRSGGNALMPAWGPNPAEIIRLKLPKYRVFLQSAAQQEIGRQISLAYRQAEQSVKAAYGL